MTISEEQRAEARAELRAAFNRLIHQAMHDNETDEAHELLRLYFEARAVVDEKDEPQ